MEFTDSEFFNEWGHPIDLAEMFAVENGWINKRDGDEQILIEVQGVWRHYRLNVSFLEDKGILNYQSVFRIRLDKGELVEVLKAVNYANQMCRMGAFTVRHAEEIFVFGCSQSLFDEECMSGQQVQHLFDSCITHCEQFYPTFQLVAFGDKDADTAIRAAILETKGEC